MPRLLDDHMEQNQSEQKNVLFRFFRTVLLICIFMLMVVALTFAGDESLDLDDISMIFYGDSRTVGLAQCAGGCTYVGKVAAGYDWMAGEGYALLQNAMAEHPDATVVFCFGVNDMGNVESYIRFFRDFQASYPEKEAFFCSVNPVADSYAAANGYAVRDAQVVAFNDRVQAELPDEYLDSYTFLAAGGYETVDGVHYGSETYVEIQNLTKLLAEAAKSFSEDMQEMMTE